MRKPRLRSTGIKLLASAGLVGAAAAVAGLGTFGTFTSTTSASQTVAAGTVSIGLGTAGTATNRLTVGASNLVPGDTIQRQVQLSNNGNQALAGISLTTTASPSSLLDTDATNGLQLAVQSCPTAWTEAGTAPAYTYTCSGTATTVLSSRPVIGSNLTLPGLNSLRANASDNLVVTLTFPTTAGNTFQGLSDTINFSFTGTQRAAQND
ncbi:MAG TPA: TasA family protein [Acidimicrobiales bacterium]|nr:TasA family protein [Acidimicrobiales bacterium]